MKKEKNKLYVVDKFLRYRADVIKYVLSAIVLVILLSIFSNALMMLFASWAVAICICSFLLLVLVLFCCVAYRVFPCLDQEKEYHGQIFYHKNTKKVLLLRDYFFNWQIQKYLEGLFVEDKNISYTWKKGSLNTNYFTKNFELLLQAADFYLISNLQLVLSDFFDNQSKSYSNKIRHYKRSDLLSVFGDNIFFKLFSKTKGKRKSFKKGQSFGFGKGFKCYRAIAPDGAYYERMDMWLPRNSSFSKDVMDKDVLVKIKTPQFEVKIWRRMYIEENFLSPLLFLYSKNVEELDIHDCNAVDIYVKVCVTFNRWRSLLSINFNDYVWIDEFNKILEEHFDINYFKNMLPEQINRYLFEKLLDIEKKTERNRPFSPSIPRSKVLE